VLAVFLSVYFMASRTPTSDPYDREYFTDLCQLARDTPRLFPIFNCGLLESRPQSDLPADWVVRRFDNDDDDDCVEVYDLLAPFREYSPVYSHWAAGDLALLSFDRYHRLFGFHLQVAARPRANSAILEFLAEHKYIKNSIQPVFVPAVGAALLTGLDQHSFIEETDPERIYAKFWPWLPSAFYRNSCFYGESNSVRHFYNDYHSSYYAPTTQYSWAYTAFPSSTWQQPSVTAGPSASPLSVTFAAPLSTADVLGATHS